MFLIVQITPRSNLQIATAFDKRKKKRTPKVLLFKAGKEFAFISNRHWYNSDTHSCTMPDTTGAPIYTDNMRMHMHFVNYLLILKANICHFR